DVEADRDGGNDERGGDVRPGQQGQSRDLRDRRSCGVRVDGAHPGQARIQRHEEVEALGLTDLADEDASRSHAQGLVDKGPEGDLTGAFERGLSALHRDPVAAGQIEFEDLFARDRALPGRNRSGQGIEHCGLAGLSQACTLTIMNRKMRAVMFRRKSTAERGRARSLEVQKEVLTELAAREGYEIVKDYHEVISGWDRDMIEQRKAFSDLKRDAAQGLFDVVILIRLDRLSRRLSNGASMLDELEEYGIKIHSAAEGFHDISNTSSMILMSTALTIAQNESST